MTNIKNTKRALISSVLSLFLCFAMLLGTTFAWFTDTVSSEGNVIQTGKLKVAFEWADGATDPANTTWTDASEGAIFDYANWEPGYTEARHLKVTNVGTLALNYQMRIVANGVVSDLADVIDVYYFAEDKALTRGDLADAIYLGTLTEVLGTEKHLSKTVYGALEAGAPSDIHTLVLKMQETAGNEYQNMDLGCTFSVELIASQMMSEEDSFDNKYDASAPNPAIPAALVRELDNKNITYTEGLNGPEHVGTLDTAYQFEPTMSSQDVEFSAYKLWHADFVVSADQDVPANSMMLAGYYSLWCEDYNDGNWVGLQADFDVQAGEEIRLVADGVGTTVNWKELCDFGNDGLGFICGATDLTGVNAGTTITVELRIYEVGEQGDCAEGGGCKHPHKDCETGEYMTVGYFTYTFPAYEVENQEELNAALDAGIPTIAVPAGTYTFPTSKLSEGTTLYCEEGTVFTGTSKLNIDGATVVGATFSNPTGSAVDQTINGTFKDCIFTGSNGLRWCYAGDTVVFENCVFDGSVYGVHFDGGATEVIFKNCTISGFNATAGSIAKVTFDGCTFVANGKGNYNGVNSWGDTDYINCTFVFDGSVDYEWVDLCGENKVMTFTNCVFEGVDQLSDYVSKRDSSSVIIIDGVEFN